MRTVKSEFFIESPVDGREIFRLIERAGRTCYKSEEKITDSSAEKFVASIIKRGHESVIEHVSVTVRIVCDRGVTHEIVRHRIASYSQESTRYCNYADDKFSNQISCIEPFFWTGADENSRRKYQIWKETMELIEKKYNELLELGATPQEARSILPNSLKTEMVMTMNLREWRHFFRLRTNKSSHPQMRELAIPMLREFQKRIPIIFDDIAVDNWNEN